jgi:hypothetical protein
LAMFVWSVVYVTQASAAQTVITARVMPVRHVVIDKDGVILRIVSNTSENVAPIVYLDTFGGARTAMPKETRQGYEHLIGQLDMSRPADYIRKSSLEILVAQIQTVTASRLKAISQIVFTRPAL